MGAGWEWGKGGCTPSFHRGLVISCEGTRGDVGAVRIQQRGVWVLCNYAGPTGSPRNLQRCHLMMMLTVGSFAKGIYILYKFFFFKLRKIFFWRFFFFLENRLYSPDCMERNKSMKWHRIHPTIWSISGDRCWGGMVGVPVNIAWFLSACALTLLSFCVMLTQPW